MTVKLHRCNAQWVKLGGHPCWRVEKALIDQGIEYERVPGPGMPWQRKQRTRVYELTGAYLYPVIELEDGRVYREDSKAMAARIHAGGLFEAAATPTPSPGGAADPQPGV
jgi:hypothetical protein